MVVSSILSVGESDSLPKSCEEVSKELITIFLDKIQRLESELETVKATIQKKEAVDLTEVVKKASSSVVRIQAVVTANTLYSDETSISSFPVDGSGFVISEDGYIVTNHHVIDGARKINIFFNDKSKGLMATVWGSDPGTDLALLKVEANDLPYLRFALDPVQVGSSAHSIGNPLSFKNVLTSGVVSGTGKSLEDVCGDGFHITDVGMYGGYVLSDARTNSGSSGSPILNSKGEVIAIHSRGGSGIGIHIDSQTAIRVLDDLMKNRGTTRPFLGAKLSFVDDFFAYLFDLEEMFQTGLFVSYPLADTPAMHAGLKEGDIIIEYNGKSIRSLNQFFTDLATLHIAGEKLNVKVLRKKEVIELNVSLQNYKVNATESIERLGIEVEEFNGDKAFAYGLDPTIQGALISSAEFTSGLKPKEVITGIMNELGDPVQPIKNTKDLVSALKKIDQDKAIVLITRSPNKSRESHYTIYI